MRWLSVTTFALTAVAWIAAGTSAIYGILTHPLESSEMVGLLLSTVIALGFGAILAAAAVGLFLPVHSMWRVAVVAGALLLFAHAAFGLAFACAFGTLDPWRVTWGILAALFTVTAWHALRSTVLREARWVRGSGPRRP